MIIGFPSVLRSLVRRDLAESWFISLNPVATSSGVGFLPATCRPNSRGASNVPKVDGSAAGAELDEGKGFTSLEGGRFPELRLAAGRDSWFASCAASSVGPERSGFSVM